LKEERWHWQSTACVAVAAVVARRQKRAMAAKKKPESKRAAKQTIAAAELLRCGSRSTKQQPSEVYKSIAPFFSSLSFFIMFFCIRFVVSIFSTKHPKNTHARTQTTNMYYIIAPYSSFLLH
jgi:hypothetical protein